LSISHAQLVGSQFGPRSAAYVASAVHAQGADLDHLVELVRGDAAARVLDLGCGGGHVTFHVAPHVGHVTAYDLSSEMLTAVERVRAERGFTNVSTQQGAAESLPFPDSAFDLVLSRYSAHHWHGFQTALAEVKRVLKPQGKAILMDVVSPGPALLDTYLQAVEMLRDPSHVRDYTLDEWRSTLREAGLLPGAHQSYRLRLEFKSWITRMNTAQLHAQAIRSLQTLMSEDVLRHFAIEADGSFTIDTMLLEATA
jgi:ubiquinone/menaquinone biosynthesis C-methylase UbiE